MLSEDESPFRYRKTHMLRSWQYCQNLHVSPEWAALSKHEQRNWTSVQVCVCVCVFVCVSLSLCLPLCVCAREFGVSEFGRCMGRMFSDVTFMYTFMQTKTYEMITL